MKRSRQQVPGNDAKSSAGCCQRKGLGPKCPGRAALPAIALLRCRCNSLRRAAARACSVALPLPLGFRLLVRERPSVEKARPQQQAIAERHRGAALIAGAAAPTALRDSEAPLAVTAVLILSG